MDHFGLSESRIVIVIVPPTFSISRNGIQMQTWKFVLLFLLLTQPALAATGKHVICNVDGVFQSKTLGNKDVRRTLRFYLDDSNARIQSDDGFIVSTTSYSDTRIEGTINDGNLGADTYFGTLLQEPTALSIQRTTGQIAVVARFFDGAEVDRGGCKATASKAPTKF